MRWVVPSFADNEFCPAVNVPCDQLFIGGSNAAQVVALRGTVSAQGKPLEVHGQEVVARLRNDFYPSSYRTPGGIVELVRPRCEVRDRPAELVSRGQPRSVQSAVLRRHQTRALAAEILAASQIRPLSEPLRDCELDRSSNRSIGQGRRRIAVLVQACQNALAIPLFHPPLDRLHQRAGIFHVVRDRSQPPRHTLARQDGVVEVESDHERPRGFGIEACGGIGLPSASTTITSPWISPCSWP